MTTQNTTLTISEKISYCHDEFGRPSFQRLSRLGDLDLEFDGWLIGNAEEPISPSRNTTHVNIYYTTRGSYVMHISRFLPNRNGAHLPHLVKTKAGAFQSHLDALEWLKEDGRGVLGENSKVAWEEMCAKLPWLKTAQTIRV